MSADPISDKVLAKAWSEVLGSPPASGSNFYALGGDSLAAMRIATTVGQALPHVDDLDAFVMTEILESGSYSEVEEALARHLSSAHG